MSRSYRKPWITDGYKGSARRQYNKNQANRAIRQTEDVPDGMLYKKFYERWDICDYRFYGFETFLNLDKPKKFWHFTRK